MFISWIVHMFHTRVYFLSSRNKWHTIEKLKTMERAKKGNGKKNEKIYIHPIQLSFVKQKGKKSKEIFAIN